MLKEEYLEYNILDKDAKYAIVDEINYKDNELYIAMSIHSSNNKQKRIELYFKGILSFRNTGESFLLEIFSRQKDQSNFKFSNTVYKVINSRYVEWFDNQSLNIPKDTGIKVDHYAIYTSNECIDILSSAPPRID